MTLPTRKGGFRPGFRPPARAAAAGGAFTAIMALKVAIYLPRFIHH
jgi:hypothetical protein